METEGSISGGAPRTWRTAGHPSSNVNIWEFKLTFHYRTRVRSLAMLVTHWLTHSLTHWLTDSCLVNLIGVTLAFEDANSILVEVVTVADVDDEDCAGNSLLQIWKPRFGHKVKLFFRLWAQGLVKILKFMLGRDSEDETWSKFLFELVIWTQPSGPLCLWQCFF